MPTQSTTRRWRSSRPAVLAVALLLALTACADSDDTGSGDTGSSDTGADGTGAEDDAQDAAADDAGSDDAGSDDAAAAGGGWDGEGPWFTIDEGAGTVTQLGGATSSSQQDVTYPIVADVVWTVDGTPFEFVAYSTGVSECPVPASGTTEDMEGFIGVGVDPDGTPMNLNAGAPDQALNTTYDADWRSTEIEHAWFSPDWVIADGEMTAEIDDLRHPETDEEVPSSITVTCR